jgi:hypothetical protein
MNIIKKTVTQVLQAHGDTVTDGVSSYGHLAHDRSSQPIGGGGGSTATTVAAGLPSTVTAATPAGHDRDHDSHQQHDDGGEMQGAGWDDKRRQACRPGIPCVSLLAWCRQ